MKHSVENEMVGTVHEVKGTRAGQHSTEDLRQAMIHYRTLFEELVGEPEMARAQAAS